MSKCKTCKNKSSYVGGIEDIPYMEMIAATLSAVAAGKIDELLTTNSDGTPKVNTFTESPMIKNAAFIIAGLGLSAYLDDETAKSAGVGMVVYGGFNLIQSYMNPTAVSGMAQMVGRPPRNIGSVSPMDAAPMFSNMAYGVVPSTIGEIETGNELERQPIPDFYENEEMEEDDSFSMA